MRILRSLFMILLLIHALISAFALTVIMHWNIFVFITLLILATLLWAGCFYKKGFVFLLLVFNTAVTVFYIMLTPQEQFKNTVWEKSCAIKPVVSDAGSGKIKISNVRDFTYRTEKDFDVKYKNIICDPNKFESLDVGVSHWDGLDIICHTMLCFNFKNGQSVVLSVEMRCPFGTSRDYYTTFFKQHELIYIWGSEEDLFDLRSTYRRNEAFYRYRTNATPQEIKQLFLALVDQTRKLSETPEFYRTLTGNCTTALLPSLKKMRPELKWDSRVLINGTIDRMFFEQGFFQHEPGESFEHLRARSIVPEKSKTNKQL